MQPGVPQAVSDLLIAVLFLSPIASLVIAWVVARRRTPPLTEELYKDFATKKELEDLGKRFDSTMREYFERQHREGQSNDDKLQAIVHSVGQIEGMLKRCPYFCSPPHGPANKEG